MNTLELELTYLAKYLPPDLVKVPPKEVHDIYFPQSSDHPILRLRKNGEKYELTKKAPIGDDLSIQEEQTIHLTWEEFGSLAKVEGKSVRKNRYQYRVGRNVAEIDVFLDALEGLVLVDFEFENEEEKKSFTPPDFCLVEITQEKFIAGGMLAGKSYKDVEARLKEFGYNKISTVSSST